MSNPSNSRLGARKRLQSNGKALQKGTTQLLGHLVDLRPGLDKEGTIIYVRNNKRMYGANAWILMCSIMIASLGLDLNSPAVIIGAMLISPLMSPILGVGLAVGINDRQMLGISLRHFGLSILIAIATSVAYFSLTPFGDATPEIIGRTSPTILDVCVALFGGLAGIISVSRKEQSNAIPGVAIATALMPPLCVTGFGIANGNWVYAVNSFYLFFINSFFIAFVTYVMSRFLKFPLRHYEKVKDERRNRWFMIGFSMFIILPSFFILRGVLQDANSKSQIDKFLQSHFDRAIFDVKKDIERDTFVINVIPLNGLDSLQERQYQRQLAEVVPNSVLRFPEDIAAFQLQREIKKTEQKFLDRIQAEKVKSEQTYEEKNKVKQRLDSLLSPALLQINLKQEADILFPSLNDLRLYVPTDERDSSLYPLLYVNWKGRRSAIEEEKLRRYVQTRAQLDTLIVAR